MKTKFNNAAGYYNFYRMGVHEAVKCVQQGIDDRGLSLRAGYQIVATGELLPEGAEVVGQVRVHSGDRPMVLYVQPLR